MTRLRVLIVAVAVATTLAVGAPTASASPTRKPPKSCVRALDLADQGFQLAADSLFAAEDAFRAVADFDAASIRTATAVLNAKGAEMRVLGPKYQAAKRACRAGR